MLPSTHNSQVAYPKDTDLHALPKNVEITLLPPLHPRTLLHPVPTPQFRARSLPKHPRLRSKSNHFCSFRSYQPQDPGNRSIHHYFN